MPPTETPPNPAAPPSPPSPPNLPDDPVKIATRKYGEIDHTELVHLLDSLEGDQAKSRFRESIYISVIIYLLLAWLAVYGPRYIFHTGQIVPTAQSIKEKNQLAELEMQQDIAKELAKPKFKNPVPKLDNKALEQLRALQRANDAAKARQLPPTPQPQPAPAPTPAPAPLPQVAQSQPAPTPPLPAAPTPQPRPAAPSSNIPDAPHPAFPTQSQQSPGQSIADAGRSAGRISGRETGGGGVRVGQQGGGAGIQILSDTRGVDFTDYIKHLLRIIKAAWLPLIPEECYPPLSKEGTTLIHFTIAKNGQLTDPMKLEDSTHDRAIDKAAWGSIVGVGQFPPLPAAYTGDTLELRIQFVISRNPPAEY